MTATTALTAQNTQGVTGIHIIPAEFVAQQVDACVEDVGVDVVKTGELVLCNGRWRANGWVTGMLASAETIEMVAKKVTQHKIPILVVDPVRLTVLLSLCPTNQGLRS